MSESNLFESRHSSTPVSLGETLESPTRVTQPENEQASNPRLVDITPAKPLICAARLVHSTDRIRNFAAFLLAALVITLIAMAWLPWQQSAQGSGRVVAFSPGERQQRITAPESGVIFNVPETLVEGSFVKEGDLLLEIQPFAADLRNQLESQVSNYRTKLQTAKIKAEAARRMVTDFSEARDFAVESALENVEAAKAKLRAKEKLLVKYRSKVDQAESNYRRQEGLTQQRIKPGVELEYVRVERDAARAELEAGLEDVKQAEAELASKQAELEQKRSEAQAKVEKAKSEEQAALGEMETVRKDLSDIAIKLDKLGRLKITAPRDGYIFQLPAFQGSQAVKTGDYLLTFVPTADEYAVELLINGNDMPLIDPGDHVRMQFEGWPAVQFSGWPEMALGTFGGEVALVDPTDDGTGKFRIMVRPDPTEKWPDPARLRQGVRVNGWVMLRQVSLAFEVWRQLNGFPPLPPEQKSGGGKDATKVPKLP